MSLITFPKLLSRKVILSSVISFCIASIVTFLVAFLLFEEGLTARLSAFWPVVVACLVFIVVFIISLLSIGRVLLIRTLEQHFRTPMQSLVYRIQQMRLDSEEVEWPVQAQTLMEMEEIEQAISMQVQRLQGLHQKMDALYVTEHQTGFFHKDRLIEALKYEIYRSARYKHEFSLLIVNIANTQGDSGGQMSQAEMMNLFAIHFSEVLRNSDMPFRVSEWLFAVLLPETDKEATESAVLSIKKRFRHKVESAGINLSVKFDLKIGYSVFPDDGQTVNELLGHAKESLLAKDQSAFPDR